jgi:hypothetical protein
MRAPAQKLVGVGLVAALLGGLGYVVARRRRPRPRPPWCPMLPEPVERDPALSSPTAVTERGHYR